MYSEQINKKQHYQTPNSSAGDILQAREGLGDPHTYRDLKQRNLNEIEKAANSRPHVREVTQLKESVNSSNAVMQAKFWEGRDDGTYQWHDEDPDANYVNANQKYGRSEDWFSWPVYFAANSFRGRLKTAMNQHNVIQGDNEANLQKACWNWALTGFTDQGVYPQKILDYFNAPDLGLPEDLDPGAWVLGDMTEDQGRQWFTDNRGAIDEIRRDYDTEMGKWWRSGDTINQETITKLVRRMIIANGFVVVDHSPYQICMHYKKADGVTFDHWWLKVDGTTIETFPGTRLQNGDIRGVKDIQIMNSEQSHVSNDGKAMGIVRFYVQSLKDVQRNHILAAL